MPDKYEVKITKQALGQMKEIVHYISHELLAPEAATNLLDKMEVAIDSLSEMPDRMALVDENLGILKGFVRLLLKTF